MGEEAEAKEGKMDTIDDILNQDHIKNDIDELIKAVTEKFDDLECVVMLWKNDEGLHHRAYGGVGEVVGLLEQSKFIMLRENTGETKQP